MVKDLLYTGVGIATIFKEKAEEEIKKMEEKQNKKKEDSKSCIEAIQKKGKEQDTLIKDKMKKMLKELIDELGIATKDDLEKLKEDLKK
jgi:polyhydroxyalkanoate synthesis regulator phasin